MNHQLSETEKINQAIAKIENSKDDASHLYINRKLDQLSDLRDNIQHQADLAKKINKLLIMTLKPYVKI